MSGDSAWRVLLLVAVLPAILAYSAVKNEEYIMEYILRATINGDLKQYGFTPDMAPNLEIILLDDTVQVKYAPQALAAANLIRNRNKPMNNNVGKRETQTYQSWENLWYPNFEDYNRAEATVGYENNTITNVTVQLGAIAYLHCYVRSSPDRALAGTEQVSWIRRRDWHILSSGVFTYTNDERFQILHGEGSDDWTLQIKYVQKRDNGTYECQVSNSHGLLSHFVNLQIVVPEATIQGSKAGEHHVDVGSIIDLVCIIDKSPTPPQYVFWYHNDRMINYDTARGGIFVETTPGYRTQSRLTIRDTTDADSGNYTCSASNTEAASVYVFVSEGDNVDAILMRKSCAMCIVGQIFTILLTTLMAAVR